MNKKTLSAPIDVTTRLGELGLSADFIRDAVEYGEAQRAAATLNDPALIPGILQWGRTIRRLRESLMPLGWRRARLGGLEVVQRKNARVAITVSMGDDATGDPERTPSTKYPKGEGVIKSILQNNMQLRLGFEPTTAPQDAAEFHITWLLLLHSTPDGVKCELSIPEAVDCDGRVVGWAERIILTPVTRELDPTPVRAEDEDSIVINVKRKAQ